MQTDGLEPAQAREIEGQKMKPVRRQKETRKRQANEGAARAIEVETTAARVETAAEDPGQTAAQAAKPAPEPGTEKPTAPAAPSTALVLSLPAQAIHDLDNLALAINDAHEQIEEAKANLLKDGQQIHRDMMMVGELLFRAKAAVKKRHLKWKPWCAKHVTFGLREAQRYLQIRKHRGRLDEAESLRQALALVVKKKPAKQKVTDVQATVRPDEEKATRVSLLSVEDAIMLDLLARGGVARQRDWHGFRLMAFMPQSRADWASS